LFIILILSLKSNSSIRWGYMGECNGKRDGFMVGLDCEFFRGIIMIDYDCESTAAFYSAILVFFYDVEIMKCRITFDIKVGFLQPYNYRVMLFDN